MYHPHAMHSPEPHLIHPPHQHCHHPHTLSAYPHATQTVYASQSQQPPHPHRVKLQPHRHIKDDHMATDTPQGNSPSSRIERNLIILQVNINVIKNKLEELKLLIHDTHADIITIRETKLKQTHPIYITSPPCVPTGCTRQEVGSLHPLEITLHLLQQTYLRLLKHTTSNGQDTH